MKLKENLGETWKRQESGFSKEKGLVNRVGSLIEELRESGYWLSDEVAKAAKKLAGE